MEKAKVVIVSTPFIVYFLFCEEKNLFLIFIAGICLLALREFYSLFSPWRGIYAPLSMLLSIFIIVLMTKGIFFNFLKTPLGLIFTASVIILVSSSIWSHNFIATIWVNNVWLRSILGLIYIPFLLAFILLLWKNLPVAPYFLLFLFFTVWVTDAAAYIGGSIFGKYHFVPSLSPSKSLEGTLIGTFMGGFLVALIAYITFLSPFLSLLQTLILSLAGSVATQVGDLVESGYKRLAAKKDTDNWLPGYGGILDTFDGMCLAAPVIFYLLWIFGKI